MLHAWDRPGYPLPLRGAFQYFVACFVLIVCCSPLLRTLSHPHHTSWSHITHYTTFPPPKEYQDGGAPPERAINAEDSDSTSQDQSLDGLEGEQGGNGKRNKGSAAQTQLIEDLQGQVSLCLRLRLKGLFLYTLLLVSCFIWSAVLDSSHVLQSYSISTITSIAYNHHTDITHF